MINTQSGRGPSVRSMAIESSPHILGTESIRKLLTQYTIPAIVAMTAISLYNMVDSIFIGQGVGAMAISGLALTLPLMNLMAAFGSMVGLGASAIMSIKLGQKDNKSAREILGNVVLLNTIIGISLAAVCSLFLDDILHLFGGSEQTLPYARDYMRILLIGNVFTHLYMGMNDLMRASGHPTKAMTIIIAAVLFNALLDWLFIFIFDWGIKGAAWATVIAQVTAMGIEIAHFANPGRFIHFSRGIFRLKATIVKGILSIGLSPFLMNVCASIVVIFINTALKEHGGDLYIGAYGIIHRIAFLFLMIVMGINMGMQPIVGYNYGARKFERVKKVLKLGMVAAVGVTTTGFVIAHAIPGFVVGLFTTDPTLLEVAGHGIMIAFMAFPTVGFQMVVSNFFQSIGKAKLAIFMSLTRQMIFLLPLLVVLPGRFGADGVWMSLPISDCAATILAAVLIARQMRIFRQMAAEDSAALY